VNIDSELCLPEYSQSSSDRLMRKAGINVVIHTAVLWSATLPGRKMQSKWTNTREDSPSIKLKESFK
jgi:hypothetical protein